ncbi:uncharacterized protein PG986_014996 [Apiospora aurea]|uniref:Uncharacterized protein n=1 Tax=Apiospora aurea TaxID=335848 RepID=A0ABR1PUL3_9PEZI
MRLLQRQSDGSFCLTKDFVDAIPPYAILSHTWFGRGWTLQELVAPTSVAFFSRDSQRLGDSASLETLLHKITGISTGALQRTPLSNFTAEIGAARQSRREEVASEVQDHGQGVGGGAAALVKGDDLVVDVSRRRRRRLLVTVTVAATTLGYRKHGEHRGGDIKGEDQRAGQDAKNKAGAPDAHALQGSTSFALMNAGENTLCLPAP